MNRVNTTKRTQVINCLVAGCSIHSTVRMTGVAKKTVMRLLVEVAEVVLIIRTRRGRIYNASDSIRKIANKIRAEEPKHMTDPFDVDGELFLG